jgi:hypothetical protein
MTINMYLRKLHLPCCSTEVACGTRIHVSIALDYRPTPHDLSLKYRPCQEHFDHKRHSPPPFPPPSLQRRAATERLVGLAVNETTREQDKRHNYNVHYNAHKSGSLYKMDIAVQCLCPHSQVKDRAILSMHDEYLSSHNRGVPSLDQNVIIMQIQIISITTSVTCSCPKQCNSQRRCMNTQTKIKHGKQKIINNNNNNN